MKKKRKTKEILDWRQRKTVFFRHQHRSDWTREQRKTQRKTLNEKEKKHLVLNYLVTDDGGRVVVQTASLKTQTTVGGLLCRPPR